MPLCLHAKKKYTSGKPDVKVLHNQHKSLEILLIVVSGVNPQLPSAEFTSKLYKIYFYFKYSGLSGQVQMFKFLLAGGSQKT